MLLVRCLLLFSTAFSGYALAAVTGSVISDGLLKVPVVETSVTNSVWQMALGLLFVLGLIFLLAWLLRRVGGTPGTKQHIKVISAVNVGTRERAVLVEVAGEQLLLGVAAGSVTLLHKLETPVNTTVSSNAGDFASKLHSATTALIKKTRSIDD